MLTVILYISLQELLNIIQAGTNINDAKVLDTIKKDCEYIKQRIDALVYSSFKQAIDILDTSLLLSRENQIEHVKTANKKFIEADNNLTITPKDTPAKILSSFSSGLCYEFLGERPAAEKYYKRSLAYCEALHRNLKDKYERAEILSFMALCYKVKLGSNLKAREYLNETLKILFPHLKRLQKKLRGWWHKKTTLEKRIDIGSEYKWRLIASSDWSNEEFNAKVYTHYLPIIVSIHQLGIKGYNVPCYIPSHLENACNDEIKSYWVSIIRYFCSVSNDEDADNLYFYFKSRGVLRPLENWSKFHKLLTNIQQSFPEVQSNGNFYLR